jgi:hypothetical protein
MNCLLSSQKRSASLQARMISGCVVCARLLVNTFVIPLILSKTTALWSERRIGTVFQDIFTIVPFMSWEILRIYWFSKYI